MKKFLAILVMLWLVQLCCHAQPPDGEAELRRADALISDSEYDQALTILISLSARYPGTSLDARACMNRAYILGAVRHNLGAARQVYQEVLDRFPNSFFGYIAESNLADLELIPQADSSLHSPAFQAYFARIRAAVMRAGGPDIAQDDLSGPIRPVAGLSSKEQELILEDLLSLVADRMCSRAANEATFDTVTYRRGVRIEALAASRFGGEGLDSQDLFNIRADGMSVFNIQDSAQIQDLTPPLITVQSPADGAVVTETSPTIRFTLSDGDVTQRQPDIDRMKVWLDGNLVYDGGQATDRSKKVFQIALNLEQRNATFMTLQVAIPTQSLSVGIHQVEVYAIDRYVKNEARKQWSFRVAQPTPISLQLAVLSKHVKPHKGELARVRATASAPPTQFTYAIYRGNSPSGQPVYTSAPVSSTSGVQELVWNGLNNAGQQVSNGSYVMVVTARSNTGATASDLAQIVVNFQGGGQGFQPGSWLLALKTRVLPAFWLAVKLASPVTSLVDLPMKSST